MKLTKAVLINYEYCSGCHSCEIACRNHLGIGLGKWGIKVAEIEPFELDDSERRIEWIYQPVPTRLCDLCTDRIAEGQKPACVHHCQAFCIEYGTPEEMLARAEEIGGRTSIFFPGVAD